MGTVVNTDATLLLDSLQVQTQLNQIGLDYSADLNDATCFGATSRVRKGTIKTASATAKGFIGNTTIDDGLWTLASTDENLLTVFPTTITDGAITTKGYAMLVALEKLSLSGDVGSLLGMDLAAQSESNVVRAVCLRNFLVTPLTSTAAGTAYVVGAVAAGQSVYGGLHVTSISGTATPTLTMRIQSDTVGFPSATTAITFTARTAVGAQWGTPLAGANTDTYWRADWTISGTNPSFTGLVWMAIL